MSYSDIVEHRNMVFDGVRNSAYTRALEKVITSTTSVMDLGAGLGVHGMIAAKLGAAKVYLVEPTIAIEVAKKVAEDNQLKNIVGIQSTAEQLNLDAKVDVIVSVFTGNFLLDEDLLPSLFYARDKFLAKGGQLVPDRGRMKIVPVNATDYYRSQVDCWAHYADLGDEHGLPKLNYTRVRSYAANYPLFDSAQSMNCQPLGQPTSLMELDFTTADKAQCNSEVEITVDSDGLCHGWMGWFEMRLVDEWLSTDGIDSKTHWSQVFFPLNEPIEVSKGDRICLNLKRPEGGEWSWTTLYKGDSQRQSSFLSQPVSPGDLLRMSDGFKPKMNARAGAASWLLQRIDGNSSVSELAKLMREAHPELFASQDDASRFVREVTQGLS
ncbi:MAG: 50S ribosomal protein L11 methyltransferase [Halioglobus sp.]